MLSSCKPELEEGYATNKLYYTSAQFLYNEGLVLLLLIQFTIKELTKASPYWKMHPIWVFPCPTG